MRKLTKELVKKRLKQIRQENRQLRAQGTGSQKNGIERLFEEVANVPEMFYTGNDRSRSNRIVLPDGRKKYPDFRFPDQNNKVIEVVGTYSHPRAYKEELSEVFSKVGVEALVVMEPDIVNCPQTVRNLAWNFYNKCPKCGNALHSVGTEPPCCNQCGKI